MKKNLTAFCVLAPLTLAACGGGTEDTAKDETAPMSEAAKPAVTEPEVELSELAIKGKTVFLRCRSCHTVKKDDVHLTGPNLYGLFGATAGEKEGYAFSDSLKASDITWSAETLEQWMIQPREFIAGNKMAFAGLPKEEDRKALVAYLEAVTE